MTKTPTTVLDVLDTQYIPYTPDQNPLETKTLYERKTQHRRLCEKYYESLSVQDRWVVYNYTLRSGTITRFLFGTSNKKELDTVLVDIFVQSYRTARDFYESRLKNKHIDTLPPQMSLDDFIQSIPSVLGKELYNFHCSLIRKKHIADTDRLSDDDTKQIDLFAKKRLSQLTTSFGTHRRLATELRTTVSTAVATLCSLIQRIIFNAPKVSFDMTLYRLSDNQYGFFETNRVGSEKVYRGFQSSLYSTYFNLRYWGPRIQMYKDPLLLEIQIRRGTPLFLIPTYGKLGEGWTGEFTFYNSNVGAYFVFTDEVVLPMNSTIRFLSDIAPKLMRKKVFNYRRGTRMNTMSIEIQYPSEVLHITQRGVFTEIPGDVKDADRILTMTADGLVHAKHN